MENGEGLQAKIGGAVVCDAYEGSLKECDQFLARAYLFGYWVISG